MYKSHSTKPKHLKSDNTDRVEHSMVIPEGAVFVNAKKSNMI